MLGPASSDGRACTSEIFASTGSGLNPASAGIFHMEMKYMPLIRHFESSKYTTEFGQRLCSMGERRNLTSNTVPPYREVMQLWTPMLKRHQVCEEIESMRGEKTVFLTETHMTLRLQPTQTQLKRKFNVHKTLSLLQTKNIEKL